MENEEFHFRALVRKYMWPHSDYGKVKFTSNDLSNSHGDIVETEYKGRAIKGVFRLIEKDMYIPEFMKRAMPIAKEMWEQRKLDEQCRYNNH